MVCYDIANSRRLRRVHRLLRDIGFPLQYSLFEATLNGQELDELVVKLNQEINDSEDRVHIFSISHRLGTVCLGCAQQTSEGFYF